MSKIITMKKKITKRFFIALVLCISLFNFFHFCPDESTTLGNISLFSVAYASGEMDTEESMFILNPNNRLFSFAGGLNINKLKEEEINKFNKERIKKLNKGKINKIEHK